MTPNEASKIKNPDCIRAINERKIREFEKINKKRTYLEKMDCCLLNPKFILVGKHTLIPNFVKKWKNKAKIPVKIIDNSLYGYYKIKIGINFKNQKVSFKKGEKFISDTKLLKKYN